MDIQFSFSELVNEAVRLDYKEYEKFVSTVNKLRAGQRKTETEKKASAILSRLNKGFSTERWERMQLLDTKMEEGIITEAEYAELATIVDDYEKYSNTRLRLLKKLALLRGLSLEDVLIQLGIPNG